VRLARGYIAALFYCPIKLPYLLPYTAALYSSPTLSSPPGSLKRPAGHPGPETLLQILHELSVNTLLPYVQTRGNEPEQAKTRPHGDSEGVVIQKNLRENLMNFLVLGIIINNVIKEKHNETK